LDADSGNQWSFKITPNELTMGVWQQWLHRGPRAEPWRGAGAKLNAFGLFDFPWKWQI